MKLSIIIPAYNEEKEISGCLQSVKQALHEIHRPDIETELIVTDNNSRDNSAQLARDAGATVVFEAHNQISRARNTGAKQASGTWLLFIDADSRLHANTLQDMLGAIETETVIGGGCLVHLTDCPWWGAFMTWHWNQLSRFFKWAAGSFLFCRRDCFDDIGGFSEELYATEEIQLSNAIKQWGKKRAMQFVILRQEPHSSSGRKFKLYSKTEIVFQIIRPLRHPFRTVRNKKKLFLWYDGRR